jgi:menaquinone-dependent protoporphyrinogen IX oxidase
MTILIAYFSWKGHTEKIATALSRLLDAECVRIEPLKDPQIAKEGVKSLLSMRTPIKPCKTDLAGIDRLVIATPVWSHKVPPYVNEYLSAITGGNGKPFHVITEMGKSGSDSAVAVVRKELEKKGMHFVSSTATIESDVESGAYSATVQTFAASIQKR